MKSNIMKKEKKIIENFQNYGNLVPLQTYDNVILNKIPEISFFKTFYYKYTPFSIESSYLNFDTSVGFGIESTVIISSLGDLVSKMYLEVTLPEISLKRSSTSTGNVNAYNTALNNLSIVKKFAPLNRLAFIEVNKLYLSTNVTDPQLIVDKINLIFDNVSAASDILNFKNLLQSTSSLNYKYSQVSLQEVVNELEADESSKDDYYLQSLSRINNFITIQKYYYDEVNRLSSIISEDSNENLKFAWVDNIGYAIIKSVEIIINGKTIDKHTGEWLKIQSELTQESNKQYLLDELIGNVPQLTTFDRNTKPKYILKIPLKFWFCEHYKLSLPLIALKSNQVTLKVTFRKIEEVSYIENSELIFRGIGKDSISLLDVPETLKINIQSRLMVDYIYLSEKERKKFITNNYEYVIETMQQLNYPNVLDSKISINLRPFVGVNTAFYWTAQKMSDKINTSGYSKTKIVNFSKNGISGNPIKFSSIIFGDYFRCPKLEYQYYNYSVPYECCKCIPSDGVNMFSLAIKLNSGYPNGHCVLENNIKRATLTIDFDDEILYTLNPNKLSEKYIVIVYATKTNIFRIKDGFQRLTFN